METIRRGSQKERAVILLQAMLMETGFNITVDGKFGAGTDRAVRVFQEKTLLNEFIGESVEITLRRRVTNLNQSRT